MSPPAPPTTPTPAGTPPSAPPKSLAREYFETIVVCVLVLLFVRGFVFMQSKIPSESMLDTLQIGDYVLVNRFLYAAPQDEPIRWLGQRAIARGDVVVFRFPEDPDLDYIKRVIGLPGDRVSVTDNVVTVNGTPLEEPYVHLALGRELDFAEQVVPEGKYFCLGDNRNNSQDSRYWGFVPRSLMKGRAAMILYSYQESRADAMPTGPKAIWSTVKKLVTFPFYTRWGRVLSRIR